MNLEKKTNLFKVSENEKNKFLKWLQLNQKSTKKWQRMINIIEKYQVNY